MIRAIDFVRLPDNIAVGDKSPKELEKLLNESPFLFTRTDGYNPLPGDLLVYEHPGDLPFNLKSLGLSQEDLNGTYLVVSRLAYSPEGMVKAGISKI